MMAKAIKSYNSERQRNNTVQYMHSNTSINNPIQQVLAALYPVLQSLHSYNDEIKNLLSLFSLISMSWWC